MKLSILLPFLLVGTSVLVSAADKKSTTAAPKLSKFPKKYDPSKHSQAPKKTQEESSYNTFESVPMDEISVPNAYYDLPLYMQPPPEFYTNSEGEIMAVMMPPSELVQESPEPYFGYGSYEPDPEGEGLSAPQPWSYTGDPSVGSAAYILSEDTENSPSIVIQPPSDTENEYKEVPSSYVSV